MLLILSTIGAREVSTKPGVARRFARIYTLRWALIASEYDITIVHRAGAAHANADVPSRYPRKSTRDNTGAQLDDATLGGQGIPDGWL